MTEGASNIGRVRKSSGHVVMAGGALGFNWLPVYVARDNGLFERAGLSVELVRTGSVDKATAAVRSGEADLAITPPEGAVADRVRGGELRIVAGNVNRLPLSLVAQSRIKRVEDLRGCKLGTSSLTEGTAIYTMEMLSKHGLHYPDDYSFDVVGVHPARWKALQEGTLDAAVQLIPLNFVAFDAGYSNLGEVSDYIPEIVFTALISSAEWLGQHREVAVALLDALMSATRWLYDPQNDAALVPLVMATTQASAEYAQKSLDYMRSKSVFARSLEIPTAAFEKTLELMVKAKLLDVSAVATAHLALDDCLSLRAQLPRQG